MVKELKINTLKKEVEEEKNLSDKVSEAYNFVKQVKEGKIKRRELKIPRKAKVKRGKLKKGWIGVLKIDENGNISGEKVRISGSAFKDKSGFYHATNGKEILFWNGKFPILVQPSWKKNPISLRRKDDEPNETYGQKPIMAKMLGDTIKVKKNVGGILLWIAIIVAAYIGYQAITGGL